MSADSLYCIAFQDVEAAASRIQGFAHNTPIVASSSINLLAQRHLYFKCEALQKTGSFKFRGATNAIQSILSKTDIDSKHMDVLTHSSGNHAQALALAARLCSTEACDVRATIVMPENTPAVKMKAVKDFQATVVMSPNNPQAREETCRRLQTPDSHFIHPSEDARVIAGQGTVCLELVEQVSHLDVVIIPVGGGGLAAGNAVALRALSPLTKIILAEPQLLDDAKRSFDAKKLLMHAPNLDTTQSAADGLRTTLGPNTWPIVRDLVDDIITVSELEILTCTKLIWERLKVVIEPSAGVGVAVAMSKEFKEKYPPETYQHVGVILCGGNVDIIKTVQLMERMGL
jgi:serine racemase